MRIKKMFVLIGTLAVILAMLVSFTACNMSDDEVGNLLSNLTGGLLLKTISNMTPSTDKTEIEGYIKTSAGGFIDVTLPDGTYSATATDGKVKEKDYSQLNVQINATTTTAQAFETELATILTEAEFVAWNEGYLLEKSVGAIFINIEAASETAKTYTLSVRAMNKNDFAEIKDTLAE